MFDEQEHLILNSFSCQTVYSHFWYTVATEYIAYVYTIPCNECSPIWLDGPLTNDHTASSWDPAGVRMIHGWITLRFLI